MNFDYIINLKYLVSSHFEINNIRNFHWYLNHKYVSKKDVIMQQIKLSKHLSHLS